MPPTNAGPNVAFSDLDDTIILSEGSNACE
jgi:hypothetical protein